MSDDPTRDTNFAAPDGDDRPEITLREDDNPPPVLDEADEPYDGSTFGLGPVVPLPDRFTAAPLSEPTLPSDAAPPKLPPRRRRTANDGDDGLPRAAPRRPKTGGDGPSPDRGDDGAPSASSRPKLRDWLEARCRKEAKMYGLAVLALAPVAAATTLLTWGVLRAAIPGPWYLDVPAAAAATAGLFWLERVTRESRSVRLRVESDDRDVQPVSLRLPRGTGLTWLMYLAGSRDRPGIVRFFLGVLLFGPRLCELVFQMARTARLLWEFDAVLMADPVKTLVKAEGKVAFAAFLGAHREPAPQDLVDRLGLIDGVLFLPTSSPPGLCTSGAMKDEFAAWRENWRDERRADSPLYD